MAKPTSPEAQLSDKSADKSVLDALAAMEAQIAALSKENAALKAAKPAEDEKFTKPDLEDPAVMGMMERRGNIPVHPTTGEPIFNTLRAAVRPPA